MKHMTSAETRQAFLDYFEEMGHKVVPSSSLVPAKDPTLLFTNAGMVQFKDVFLGLDKRAYDRATTAQKVMRIQGKHNDLEEVGPSPRHHTFFEMLGNFSFGSYFKSEACRFAYDVMTKVYELPADRLYFTVHKNDADAYRIWIEEIGVPKERVYKLGDDTNFWQMADTGPCGPTAEIHWDWDPSQGTEAIAAELEHSSGRMLELWNLVFMQYNQNADGSRELLPAPGVDTGLGLERIASVLQGVRINYQTDLFTPIIARIQTLNSASDAQRQADPVPYNVIADHMRAASFLIADGVTPGAKDRGYVCRMVIRRAARFGRRIGFMQPFLAEVADAVVDTMGGHYKELVERRDTIRKAITQEEVRFGRTLERGLAQLNEMLAALPTGGQLSGEQAFFLKGSLGLPFEVTRDVAQEQGYGVDQKGFEAAEKTHGVASGGGHAMGEINQNEVYSTLVKRFKESGALPAAGVAYDPYSGTSRQAQVLALLIDGQQVESAEVGGRVEVVLDGTCFYVEAGGQVSDTGTIRGEGWTIDIEEVRRPIGGLIVHVGEVVEGQPQSGSAATAEVDRARRLDIMRNHTATHLLHAQLRAILGTHVQQRGSLVAPDRLRFDFSHDTSLTNEELQALTANINDAIMANMPVITVEKDLESARKEGAMALFGEKYGDRVRTVTIQNSENGNSRYSYELCGGTHVPSTAVIGSFVVAGESSVAQGIRRIEAFTGHGAQQFVNRQLSTLRHTAAEIGATPDQLGERVEALQDEITQARQENAKLRRNLARLDFERVLAKRETLNGVPVLITQVEPTTSDFLREMTDWFRDKEKQGVVVLGMVSDGKPQLIAAVSDDLSKRVHAGNLIKAIAPIIGGGGGGRPNMAQAGGKDASKLSEALDQARKWIADALNKP